ncbi:MAG: hypothetical protein UT90_C0006G0055 [Parcubacteria group bacterium GW2011_GWA1_40_21]|nr:MAG: hypothetical protein UT80_C0004G0019 [Parcubacteria group bacterium GW2011_GWC1_40_13]KKR53643.1 MAG: hypothetical protein UT90_C0006G0055 [Parcubacteria group bacterium GW2011_GWA1_40_21]
MEKIDVEKLLSQLEEKRPVFHSEADLQHELAWLLHNEFPRSSVRLEKPYTSESGKSEYVDIFAGIIGKKYFIELKYKTKELKPKKEINGEKFHLKNQGAQDCGRYDFWKDVSRIESKVAETNNSFGYVIFLTNDHSYLREPRKTSLTYNYRTTDGRKVTKCSLGSLKGYNKGRERNIKIKNSYEIKWKNYGNHDFKFLLLEIKK